MHFTVFQNVRFCFLLVHLETSLQTVENTFETTQPSKCSVAGLRNPKSLS